jgi:N-acetylglutamate synthase-like GNAT family acetyltransferase
MGNPDTYHILHAAEADWEQIVNLAEVLNLDNNDMHVGQFKVYEEDRKVLGIGRIKTHHDCVELCTLGVEVSYRGRGIGKALVNSLLENLSGPVYLVTEIPAYFEKLGFRPVNTSIQSLQAKKNICMTQLSCANPVIMVRNI